MPHLTRRSALAGLLSIGLPGARLGAEEAASAVRPLAAEPNLPRRKDRLVLSHWHFFPLSFDNKGPGDDYYDREMLTVDGEKGRHAAYGGFLRDRPFPREPIPERDWRTIDAITDIAYGQDAGLDGFQFNIASFDPKHRYIDHLNALLTAVAVTGTSFRIAPGLDCHTLKANPPLDIILPQLVPILKHPSVLRMADGRPMLSCFRGENWSVDVWRQVFDHLEKAGIKVYFAPVFLDLNKASIEHIALADMVGCWQGNNLSGVSKLTWLLTAARQIGKACMFSVWPQDARPRRGWFSEARNSELFRTGWDAALKFAPECVNVLTWNDYSENSHIRPSLGVQYAFTDLNRYYSDTYRFGQSPQITKDVLYYFARRDFTEAGRRLDEGRPALQPRFDTDAVNEVELLAFLASSGRLKIETSAGVVAKEAPMGMTSLRAPLAPGRPSFSLGRNSALVTSVTSHFEVRDRWDWQDILYRGGSSSRPVATLAPPVRTLPF